MTLPWLSPVNTTFVNKSQFVLRIQKGTGDDKQRKDAGNRTLYPYRNFNRTIIRSYLLPNV